MPETPISEALYVRAIGTELLAFAKQCDLHKLARQMDSDALSLLCEIKTILDDSALDDPTCFLRVDAIVQTFFAHGLTTDRHRELD